MMINIFGAQETYVELGLTEKCVLKGKIVLYRMVKDSGQSDLISDAKANPNQDLFIVGTKIQKEKDKKFESGVPLGTTKTRLESAGGISNIIVEMRREDEVQRRVTDLKGTFLFDNMRPGQWTITFYDTYLPAYHQFEKDLYEIEFKPGHTEELLIKVVPKRRKIQLQEDLYRE